VSGALPRRKKPPWQRAMSRINFFYALAYIVALVAAIPYWRYLGLMG
jgi:hypothetical protein